MDVSTLMDQNTSWNDELYHFGVKGMKWGVRRYQNKDGSLTNAGRKKYSKEYKKSADAVIKKLKESHTKRYVDSYNKAADYMNTKGIKEFNNQQKKKYGDKYMDRPYYDYDYMKVFSERLDKEYNKSLYEFYKTDSDYKRSKELVKKYNMTKWNEFAKKNEAMVDEVRRFVEDYN